MKLARYTIVYRLPNGKFEEVFAYTIKEANILYDMIGEEAAFKVLVDNVSQEQLRTD